MKRFIIIALSLLVIIGIAIGIISWLDPFLQRNISGYLTGYEKYEGKHDYKDFIGVGKDVIKDTEDHPEKYSEYRIDFYIKNTADHGVYDLNTKLSEAYPNVWLDDPFVGSFVFNLTEDEDIYFGFFILVKTGDMNEDEIDKLISSIGINIFAHNTTDAPVFASNPIHFYTS